MNSVVQDDSDNITRFLMLAREPIIPGTDRPFKVITTNIKSIMSMDKNQLVTTY